MPINWRREVKKSDLKRRKDMISPKQALLIVCEGEKTEPYYFEAFRVRSARIHVLGMGFNTLTLVKEAIRLRDEAKKDGYILDQVWCVFDKDSFSSEEVNAAFDLAKRKSIHIAYSNEAFEIWYILHFEYFVVAWSRDRYKEKLTQHLGFKYEKRNREMYRILIDKQQQAINHACRLLATYNPYNPAKNNPSTTVHLLVAELNKFLS